MLSDGRDAFSGRTLQESCGSRCWRERSEVDHVSIPSHKCQMMAQI